MSNFTLDWCRVIVAKTAEKRVEALAAAWNRLVGQAADNESNRRAFAELVAAYGEPERHYHNLDHIAHLLEILDATLDTDTGKQSDLLRFAAWYHDLVYDPRRSDNESRSADAARLTMRTLGQSDAAIDRVCDLILMTQRHQAEEADLEGQLFLDADLFILGTYPPTYQAYAAAIRREYSWVPDRVFFEGRRKVLLGFGERPMIYRTDMIRSKIEPSARRNIAAEIAQIDDILRTLPP